MINSNYFFSVLEGISKNSASKNFDISRYIAAQHNLLNSAKSHNSAIQNKLKSIHKSLNYVGFRSSDKTVINSDIDAGCKSGKLSCEQFVFIYLSLLASMGEDILGSRVNQALQSISFFNQYSAHVAFLNKDGNVFEPSADSNDLIQGRNDYSFIFKHQEINSIKDLALALDVWLSLEPVKHSNINKYIKLLKDLPECAKDYPSKDFYKIELVNQYFNLIDEGQPEMVNPQILITMLEELKSCPYLSEQDLNGCINEAKNLKLLNQKSK